VRRRVSFWAALDADILELVSDTRVGQAWGARLLAWVFVGAVLWASCETDRAPVLRRAALGAEGAALGPAPSHAQRLALVVALGALALTAPAAGHSWTQSPRGLLIGNDTLHVLAVGAWLGALVMLLAVVGSVAALVETGYGRLVLAKILLFAGLIAVGAYNQRRLLPRLSVVATGDEEPGRGAALLRRSVALEVGIAVLVLSLTSVLVTSEPVTG
jgi:copper transport protein